MTIKKEDIFQAFFGAGLEGDYNFLEDDLIDDLYVRGIE